MPPHRDCMREMLLAMFRGWKLQAESYDPEKDVGAIQSEEAYTQACGGDKLVGATLALMDYWSNDLQWIAPHYGISYERDEATGVITIREDIPPAPSPRHYWDEGQWNAPPKQDDETAETPVNG